MIRGKQTKPASEKPDWKEVALAYEEAAEHLDICAAESGDPKEKAALKLVAGRIRGAGNRVRPPAPRSPQR